MSALLKSGNRSEQFALGSGPVPVGSEQLTATSAARGDQAAVPELDHMALNQRSPAHERGHIANHFRRLHHRTGRVPGDHRIVEGGGEGHGLVEMR